AVIPKSEVVRLAPRVRDALASVDPALGPFITYEVATALALLYFREAGAQVAVIEVGLGGRLDATNVVDPLVSVITSISYDHMNVLGNTLAEIAREKAGIIKPGVPVVTSATAPEAVETLVAIAAARAAPLTRVGPSGTPGAAYTYRPTRWNDERQAFSTASPYGTHDAMEIALLGEHQVENATAAIAVAERLNLDGLVPISEDALRAGLRAARWPARMQLVRRAPDVIVDGAHNADSFAKLFAALRRHFTFARLVLVLGLMADKDIPGMVREIASAGAATVLLTSFVNTRVAPPAEVAALLRAAAPALDVRSSEPSAAALADALSEAAPNDLICVSGGIAFAGEALRWLAAQPGTIPGAIEIAGVDH
ncbi:MAG: bifunctional folylpolyglutamate synthase/dihydrofolate synthase, partial [Ktedonobacterales bacterium]